MQADRSSELRACFKRSYDDVLKHHHGWFIQSAVTVRIVLETEPFSFIYFCFPLLCPVVLSAGHHGCTVPIGLLQTDIAGGIARETGRRIGEMARGPERDRCPHEALPGRRWLWYGIESGAVGDYRRLVMCTILWITHFRSWLPDKEK